MLQTTDPETEPMLSVTAPVPVTLDREDAPLLSRPPTPVGGEAGPIRLCCAQVNEALHYPACPRAGVAGYRPVALDPDRYEAHTEGCYTSSPSVRDKIGECVTSFAEGLLTHEERRETTNALVVEDRLRVPWLRVIAKLASREIQFCCIPISHWAKLYLKHELEKIAKSVHQNATFGGKQVCCLWDPSTQVSGEERAQRLVSAVIRAESQSHAFDAVPGKRVPKSQKQHDHSLFRQLAEKFQPPGAGTEAVLSNGSNHPVAGASRKVGVTATREALKRAGYKMFDPSKSNAARDKLAAGRRMPFCAKDLQHPDPDDDFTPGMVYTLVDQDMYINSFEAFAGENIVIITPEYDKLSGVGTDSVWYYTISARGDPVVTERVASFNGATYKNQRPWNYTENDFIHIEHPGKACFTTYNVHIQYQPGSHHKWVWLARNTTVGLSKAVCDMMINISSSDPDELGLESVPLRKAQNVTVVKHPSGEFLLGKFGDPNAPVYSIKYACDQGPDTSMELSENNFKVFSLMGKNRPKGYGVTEVKRTMQMHMIWRPGGLEPLLVEFFGIPVEYRPLPCIMYTSQAGSAGEVVEGEGTATQGAPNVAGHGPGVADTKSDAAHDAYYNKRLVENRNTTDPPGPLKDIVGLLLPRFIELISAETCIELGSVPLVEREEIYKRRTGALQAARLQRNAELLARDPMPKTNLKHEVTAKASAAPRGITQYTEEMAIQTGRVGLLAKEVLKHCAFYQPGNSPHDIAISIRQLTQLASEAATGGEAGATATVSGVHDTDYSKMDETISEYIYSWFVDFVLAFVHKDDYEEVNSVLKANVNIVTMLNGKPIKTGYKNNSGSGVTTELNTFVSAFIEYMSTCLAVCKAVWRARHKDDGMGELDFANVTKSTIRSSLTWYIARGPQGDGDRTSLIPYLWGDFMFEGEPSTVMGSLMQETIKNRGGDPRTQLKEAASSKGDSAERYTSTVFSSVIKMYGLPYSVVGPKFGDDGVAPHLPGISNEDWEAAAMYLTAAIGMKLKVSFSTPEEGTFFLGRYYPRPLESLASYADVPKALRKLSIARNLDLEKYVLKLRGYWTTDSRTPGIREYLQVVAKIYDVDLEPFYDVSNVDSEEDAVPGHYVPSSLLAFHDGDDGTPTLSKEMAHLFTTDRDMFYRVSGGPYRVTDDDIPMMLEAIAPQVGYDNASEFRAWLDQLSACTTWEELDGFQLPGMDYDPDDDPEGVIRVGGPVVSLFAARCASADNITSLEDLTLARDLAVSELSRDPVRGKPRKAGGKAVASSSE